MTQSINEGHVDELLDRAFMMCQVFDTVVVGHPAAELVASDIEAVAEQLADLYGKIGALRRSRAAVSAESDNGQ